MDKTKGMSELKKISLYRMVNRQFKVVMNDPIFFVY